MMNPGFVCASVRRSAAAAFASSSGLARHPVDRNPNPRGAGQASTRSSARSVGELGLDGSVSFDVHRGEDPVERQAIRPANAQNAQEKAVSCRL